ncbi:MAG: ComF family protein [Flavobacteriaceae bacterium]|nr:ComF family protein [Flavobacteriaceae bacterium]MDG1911562.1 ComF family protein [Flavobacteriaceae bacterium]
MKKLLAPILQSFSDLLFPRTCLGCNQYLNFHEAALCLRCQIELPQTHFHLTPNNPVFKKLKLLFTLEAASAAFVFQKEGRIADLIHQFKYNGNLSCGNLLAHYLANTLDQSAFFKKVEGIIPVPLHPSRQRKRGFNQAEIIGKVLSKKLGIPLFTEVLIRYKKTRTLAHIGEEARWIEIKDAFKVNSSSVNLPKHLLLIDDVITTGATLAACTNAFKKNSTIKLSIAALACRL